MEAIMDEVTQRLAGMSKERALEAAKMRLLSGGSHTFTDAVEDLPVSVDELRDELAQERPDQA